MATTETPQLAPLLELALQYEPEAQNRVKQHWHVTFSRQRKMTVYSKRIMARVMEQIKDDDLQLREFYQLRVSSLVEGTENESQQYTLAKKALYELAAVQWEFEDLETNEWYLRHLLDSTKKRRVGIKDGIITILLNPELAPYFIQIAEQQYSTFKLDGYMGLHSWYSMRFFEILSAFRDTGWWEVSIEEYRLLMDCGPELDKFGQPKKDKKGKVKVKLASTKDLIAQTITGAQKELADTPFAFDYRPVLATAVKRGRPKIVALRFDLHHRQLTVIPPSWLTDKGAGPVINSLRGFKITDKNIALYLKTITLAGAKKLLREWQLKENSQQKIDDKTKYCNAVFVRVGKQMMADQKAEVLQARKHVQQALFPNLTN